MSASARRIRTLAVCLAITAVSAAPAVGQASRPPTVDDILDLVQVSSPQISPDGSRVLFTQSEIRGWKDNKRVSSIWIANADGSNRFQFLGSGKDRSPRWSPDGAHVAFLSTRQSGENDSGKERKDEDEAPQIWLLRARGGEAWTLTDHKGRIKSFEWSRDGSQIFFLSEDAKTDEEKAAEKAGDDAIYVDEGPSGQERGRYPVSTRAARLRRTAPSADPRRRGDRVADETRARDRLEGARAEGSRREGEDECELA